MYIYEKKISSFLCTEREIVYIEDENEAAKLKAKNDVAVSPYTNVQYIFYANILLKVYEGHPKRSYTDHEGEVRFPPFLAPSRIIFSDERKSTSDVGPVPCAPVVHR